MEKFGEPSVFQIEYIHEPIPNSRGNIFGRMCLRFDNDVLGDLDEPTCMLNVPNIRNASIADYRAPHVPDTLRQILSSVHTQASGNTAVTSISTRARSSIRARTSTAVMAGKCLPMISR